MARSPEKSITLSQNDIDAFWRDGVICIRQLYSPEWIARVARALDVICSSPSPITRQPREGTFHSDLYTWLTNDDIRDFVLYGPSAQVAQQAFRSERINFFYDQIFVKEQMSPNPTPWHHDFTFWPLQGDQIASLWMSVDRVNARSSALEFVAGSHRWPQRFRAIGADGMDYTTGQKMDELPDVEGHREDFNVVSWELEPGDALLFHALTLHGSRGNRSPSTRRRAIATRWCGDDVTYRRNGMPEPYKHGLGQGDRLSGRLYPQILPEIDRAAVAERLASPILPDPDCIPDVISQLMKAEKVPVPLDLS